MVSKIQRQRLTQVVVAALLATGATEVSAQAARSAEERRAQREREAEQKPQPGNETPAVQAAYPEATREEPEAKARAKSTPQLKKMFDAYNGNDRATVVQLADQWIADSEANAYERAIAARLAGSTQLNVDNGKARSYFEKAVAFDGLNNNEHYETMFLIAQLQLQEQKYAESLATSERFLAETKSQKPEHLAVKGNALYRLKRYPEAVAALKQAVDGSSSPKPEWLQLLMGTYADMGKPAEAAKLAETVDAAKPGDTQSQLNLAATYMQSGQDDKAATILEQLRTRGELKSETDYRNLYAMYINADGKQKQGIAVINEGLEKGILKPDYHVYSALAQAYFFSEQTPQAIDAYTKAAPLAPDGEAYLQLARILSNEGRAAAARRAAEQALAKGVKKPEDAKRIIANNK